MSTNMKLLSTRQLAGILQVTRQAIYKWRKAGMPVSVNNSGRRGRVIRYNYDEVVIWLNETERIESETV